jgi:hypothetical protein
MYFSARRAVRNTNDTTNDPAEVADDVLLGDAEHVPSKVRV